jgi:2-oxoglutarate ferredoxin oxidoreductase subunit gamma
MHEEIIFAGFGGQGVLFAGQLLAYTALAEGKHVTWIPSYGPEMRGGTANCTVVISDEPIGSPVSQYPSVAVVFNNPSLEKYENAVKPGGLLIINESLVTFQPSRTHIHILALPATELASELGEVRLANMILFGAMLACRPIVALETTQTVLIEKLGARKAHLHDANIAALKRGQELAAAQNVEA